MTFLQYAACHIWHAAMVKYITTLADGRFAIRSLLASDPLLPR